METNISVFVKTFDDIISVECVGLETIKFSTYHQCIKPHL